MARPPSPDRLVGFVRKTTKGRQFTCQSDELARGWFKLTDEQIAAVKAGEKITLEDGATVEWKT